MNKENKELSDPKKSIQEPELVNETRYNELTKLMKNIKCMTACKDKLELYQTVAEQLKELSDYEDAEECSKECMRLAKQTEEEIKKVSYNRALNHKKSAKTYYEFLEAADEFREINGYMDADRMAYECEQKGASLEKKSIRKSIRNRVIVVICILFVLFGSRTAHAKYYKANFYMMTGAYSSAIKGFTKLGTYKASEEKLKISYYKNGLDLESRGDYIDAQKSFDEAGNYKDSDEKKVQAEKHMMNTSKVGDVVGIGNCKWIILEKTDNQVLLLKKAAMFGIPYHSVVEQTTWEKSTIRQYLNSNFLAETFSKTEQNNIVLSSIPNEANQVYGTEGGSDTKDYLFLLSMKEAEQYHSYFKKLKTDTWLRSPGYNQYSAAFVSVKGSIMNYGYVTTSEDFTVRPAMWYSIQ